MAVYTIASRKGGNAKTTTAQSVAAGLVKTGKKVLLIDLDSQTNLSLLLNASEDFPSVAEVMNGAPIEDATQPTECGDLIRGNVAITRQEINAGELRAALEPIKNKYDFVLIDTGAQIDAALVAALIASDRVIITAQPDILSAQGVTLLNGTIEAVRKHNKALKGGILLTRYNPRSKTAQTIAAELEKMGEAIGAKLYTAKIRECTAVKDAQARQLDIYTYKRTSNAAKDYAQLIKEMERE